MDQRRYCRDVEVHPVSLVFSVIGVGSLIAAGYVLWRLFHDSEK